MAVEERDLARERERNGPRFEVTDSSGLWWYGSILMIRVVLDTVKKSRR
jgi:hypothetical protein